VLNIAVILVGYTSHFLKYGLQYHIQSIKTEHIAKLCTVNHFGIAIQWRHQNFG